MSAGSARSFKGNQEGSPNDWRDRGSVPFVLSRSSLSPTSLILGHVADAKSKLKSKIRAITHIRMRSTLPGVAAIAGQRCGCHHAYDRLGTIANGLIGDIVVRSFLPLAEFRFLELDPLVGDRLHDVQRPSERRRDHRKTSSLDVDTYVQSHVANRRIGDVE
jgi:hypothetical protein